ncbi:MAG: dihydrofolate reductase [Rhodospirillales bacterium]
MTDAGPDICLVVAMSDNRVIGRDGGLPWHLPSDLKFFRQVTMGHPVIMGRKTFESIGRPLPGRENIVVTRDPGYARDGIVVSPGLEDALALAAGAPGGERIMVIGGGQIYAAAMARATHIILTEVHMTVDGDTTFPEMPASQWREVSRDDRDPEQEGDPGLSFVILERIGATD